MTTIKEQIISMYEILSLELTKYEIVTDPLDENKINEYLAYIDWYFDNIETDEEYQQCVLKFINFKGYKINKIHKDEVINLLARYIQHIKILIN